MYLVKLISEDGHKFDFKTKSKSSEEAINNAHNKLEELFYDSYAYTVYFVKNIV